MSIKRILVPLPGSADHAGETQMALSAAKLLGAHVEALFITEPPPAPRGGTSVGRVGFGGSAAAVAPVNWFAEEREKAARDAHERFAGACAAAGIPLLTAAEDAGAPLAASWREAEGPYVEIATQRAAAFDLIVAASGAVMEPLKAIAEESLLQTRRPVLLAPLRPAGEAPPVNLTNSVMIAWDESPECWRAVSAALPFLTRAQTVRVVSVDRRAEARKDSQAEVVAYLRCHGIVATAKVVAPDLRSVGDTLLAMAGEHDVGLMVMGAYSHSRLREMLLGGATRYILQHASARPVLLAH
ncbi:MAG: universal stress protein [Alphaproteobacteria bacterium]|nr:universal stress protein [Alphaproteobacteria bacterium]